MQRSIEFPLTVLSPGLNNLPNTEALLAYKFCWKGTVPSVGMRVKPDFASADPGVNNPLGVTFDL